VHDGHSHSTSCGECASFVAPFPGGTGLESWGYCRIQHATPPAKRQIEALAAAYRSGNREALRCNHLGIFRTEPDDACDFFKQAV
jgi:hypothetical protein